jgi:hypothetical protein
LYPRHKDINFENIDGTKTPVRKSSNVFHCVGIGNFLMSRDVTGAVSVP